MSDTCLPKYWAINYYASLATDEAPLPILSRPPNGVERSPTVCASAKLFPHSRMGAARFGGPHSSSASG
jgi:hypothetical protein